MMELTAERLREVLNYDPDTGVFVWRKREGDDPHTRMWNTRFAGEVAGSIRKSDGYRVIRIDVRLYLAHRLVFLFMTGKWPIADVDHINMNKVDNRWCNLREATQSQNNANTRKRKNNTSGYKGASWHGSGWRAQIHVSGKHICLGTFPSPEEAHAVYCEAARKHFGDFARAR